MLGGELRGCSGDTPDTISPLPGTEPHLAFFLRTPGYQIQTFALECSKTGLIKLGLGRFGLPFPSLPAPSHPVGRELWNSRRPPLTSHNLRGASGATPMTLDFRKTCARNRGGPVTGQCLSSAARLPPGVRAEVSAFQSGDLYPSGSYPYIS